MRKLSKEEIKRVSGGKTDWDRYNKNHGITGPINNPYGNMPHPPNVGDFAAAVGEGAVFGGYLGGPVGALDGAIVGGGAYLVSNFYYNAKDYWF